jgi:hypothetical protein
MGKTRAEYQKDYMERKKNTDSEFLAREKNRVKSYRVRIDQLPTIKKPRRRLENRIGGTVAFTVPSRNKKLTVFLCVVLETF